MARYPLSAGDVLFILSNSGRNPVPIEMAMAARARGAKVIAITSRRYSEAFPSRHSSGRRLAEVADLVLDNGGVVGDAAVSLAGLPTPVGPTSTITTACLLNAILVEAVARVVAAGGLPEVYLSANREGSVEHNARLLAKYKGRIPHL